MSPPLAVSIRRTITALLAAALVSRAAFAGQDVSPPALRAAFLYTFVKFTDWSKDAPTGPVAMCVLGDTAVADALVQVVAGRTVNGRDLTVVAVSPGRPLRTCHLLYVGGADAARAARALDEVAGAPVLTVGDGEAFVRQGGIAGLYIEAEKMRFAISPESAVRAGLRLSSKLLGLARIVKDDAHVQS